MTYLTRPVFEFRVNWKPTPSVQFDYELNEITLGFGGASLAQLQENTGRQIELELVLEGNDSIADFEAFADSVSGRASGFWIAHPERGFKISSGVSSTQLDAVDSDLVETLTDHPSQHFLFTKQDGTTIASKCTSAATFGDFERLTFDPSLGATPDDTWKAQRLLYVRFASDEESATLITEGLQTRTLRLVELPTEYADILAGDAPVFLYRFYVVLPDGTESSWRYTNAPDDIVSNGDTFTAKNLRHGSLLRSMRAENEELTVDAVHESGTPWADYIPFPSTLPLWLELLSADFATPDTTTQEFVGRLGDSPEFDGRSVTMKFASWLDALDAQLPRPLIGPRCPYKFGDLSTCKVDTSSLEKTATVNAQVGTRMSVEDASLIGVVAGYFAGGWLVAGSGTSTQVRAILSSTADSAGVVTLRLNARLVGISDGASVTLTPGCDKSPTACSDKWSNFDNYGGKPFKPRANLTLNAIEIDPGAGGKK